MSLQEDIKRWQEPRNGSVSCEIDPKDHSCDNSILFSAELVFIGGQNTYLTYFNTLFLEYEYSPGLLSRYPGDPGIMDWDDHLGAAAVSPFCASRINKHGEATDWMFGTQWLGRLPIFIPTVRASAGLPLNYFNQAKASVAFIWNCFEKREETSGKILLWLASKALYGKYRMITAAIDIWRYSMRKKYPGGMNEVMGIYFQPKLGKIPGMVPHPFSVYVGSDFQ